MFAHVPSHWLFLPIEKGDFQAAAFFGLMNETSAGGNSIAAPLSVHDFINVVVGEGLRIGLLNLVV